MKSVPNEFANVTNLGEATSILGYGVEFKTILTNWGNGSSLKRSRSLTCQERLNSLVMFSLEISRVGDT